MSSAHSWVSSARTCSSTSSTVGSRHPTPQTGEPTYAAKIESSDLEIDWDAAAAQVDRVVRAGRAWTTFRGSRLLVLDGQPTRDMVAPPGELAGVEVGTGDGGYRARLGAARGAQAPRRAGVAQRRARAARRTPRHVTDPRTVALDALVHIERDDAYANLALPAALSRSDLSDRDRAFATELVYGTLRMRRACDWLVDRFVSKPPDLPVRTALRLGAYQLAFLGTAPHAAVERDRVCRSAATRERSSTRSCAGSPPSPPTFPDEATRLSYPDWIVERLVADLGAR